jgi:hypothetical protein
MADIGLLADTLHMVEPVDSFTFDMGRDNNTTTASAATIALAPKVHL